MAGTCILITPALNAADLAFDGIEVCYLVSGTPHYTFTRISGCITAMITLERCLSVAYPLKVDMLLLFVFFLIAVLYSAPDS